VATKIDNLLGAVRNYLSRATGTAPLGAFVAGFDWALCPRQLEPNALPCVAYLDRIARLAGLAERELVGKLADAASVLRWGQTYSAADFGQHFLDNYGWVELFGTRGHYENDSIAGGFLVLGPGIVYPDHHHIAEEIYIPLTGTGEWRMGHAPFHMRAGGEVIHHASNVSHAMRTGADPLLAFYLWRGGPLAQRSTITGKH
jgi:hypothetical protein